MDRTDARHHHQGPARIFLEQPWRDGRHRFPHRVARIPFDSRILRRCGQHLPQERVRGVRPLDTRQKTSRHDDGKLPNCSHRTGG